MYKVGTSNKDGGSSYFRDAGVHRRRILEDQRLSFCVFLTVHLDIIV
jgi:hypothetical protein